MELVVFFIWLIVVFLVSWILALIALKNIKSKQRNTSALTWAFIFALFAGLIYGLIAYPFVTYNDCKVSGIFSIFVGTGAPACNKLANNIMFFTYAAIFLTLLALLLTTVA